MAGIKIISPGMYTTIQDLGRFGFQKSGMPVAGAMDSFSLRIANIIVGNNEDEACLEITLMGPKIEFECNTIIAITGANLSPQVNGADVDMWSSIDLKSGDVLSFGPIKTGCRSYISIAGGINVPFVMGSKSTYTRGHVGGFQGRPLKAGDELNFIQPRQCRKYKAVKFPEKFLPDYMNAITVRVVLGPQEDYFSEEGINTFLNSEYNVTNEADRMGYKLLGPEIAHKNGADIISDGITLGAVQVPGHGSPIVMMADRQTTGGYTKIATVITPDINYMGQLKPGDKLRFKAISIEEAQKMYREYTSKLENIKIYTENVNIISSRKFKVRVNSKEFELLVQEIRG